MRVGFMGTPAFAVATLDALVAAGHEVVLVVAQPDRPVGRGRHLQSPPTVERARALGIPTAQPTKLKSGDFPPQWAALGLDVGVVVAYGRILPAGILYAPRLGCVNVHASLLPRWRGAAPIQWSILAGDAEAGVTTMRMDEGLDTGAMLLQARVPLRGDETSGTLHDRLAPIGGDLLVRTLATWDRIEARPQPAEGVTHAPMLTKDDGALDWRRPAAELDAQVRGLSPWPGAWTLHRGELLKVHRVERAAGSLAPGELGRGCVVGCGEGALRLIEVQAPGRNVVSGEAWMNGARVAVGSRLGAG